MTKVNYSIPVIHCNHCAMTIKTELGDVKGVSAVEINVDEKSAEISFDEPATEKSILDVLNEIGYPAVL